LRRGGNSHGKAEEDGLGTFPLSDKKGGGKESQATLEESGEEDGGEEVLKCCQEKSLKTGGNTEKRGLEDRLEAAGGRNGLELF